MRTFNIELERAIVYANIYPRRTQNGFISSGKIWKHICPECQHDKLKILQEYDPYTRKMNLAKCLKCGRFLDRVKVSRMDERDNS